MRLARTKDDERPFASEGTGAADAARLVGGVGGEHLGQLVDGGVKNRFRARVERWAKERGLPVVDSQITVVAEGVTSRVALYEVTEVTAVVRATAAQPTRLSVSIEPIAFAQRLLSRFGRRPFVTGDLGFDRQWRVVASDHAAAHQLFDDEGREALRDVGCWCRATYVEGEIEVRLDDARLAGAHLLGGIEIALLLAQARIHTTAYR